MHNERRMHALFERFIFNFYRREQKASSAQGANPLGSDHWKRQEAMKMLPKMLTDISLKSVRKKRKIVIDTKYYQEALQQNFGKFTVRSNHLYQLFAYVKNLAIRGGLNKHAEGILLYPAFGRNLDLACVAHGHSIRVCTIDLTKDWQEIRRDLLALIGILVDEFDSVLGGIAANSSDAVPLPADFLRADLDADHD